MQRTFHFTILTGALAFALSSGASAAGPLDRQARIERAPSGSPLAVVGQGTQRDAVLQRLRTRGEGEATLASVTTRSIGRLKSGFVQVRFEQEVGGVPVHGSLVKATFNDRGELLHLVDKLAPVSARVKSAGIGERQALEAAMARVHPGVRAAWQQGAREGRTLNFQGGAFFHRDASVTRVLTPGNDGVLAEAFLVETWTEKDNLLDHTLVSGSGEVLSSQRRTSSDSYNVFAIDPAKGPQAVVNGPGAGNAESPQGWLSGPQKTLRIKGNNVRAYLDTDNNDRPDQGGTRVIGGNFLAVADLAAQPATTTNREVAVQNLFYLTNRIHDILYRHGFDEAAGNFQTDNFAQGGVGGDEVKAEAQDGGGINNANFATPPDGRNPRMQMYLWTGPDPTHEVAVTGGPLYAAMGASFGPPLDTTGFTGTVVAGNDGVAGSGGGTVTDGCEALPATISGKIVLLDRGFCNFTQKAANAQAAGAVGMILANNQATPIFAMGGTPTTTITISSVMISQADGADLRARTSPSVTMRSKVVQPLLIEGSIDSDVVYHEYGHGLTWRMIDNMDGPLSGALGEGASDTLAFMVNGDDVIGEYAFSNPNGIRRNRYTGYPRTYSAVTGAEVHNDGEIYAGTMWRLRELWLASGRSNDALITQWVDAMNFIAPGPAYEHMRNGLLDSIATGEGADATARCALVWQAFAQFGIGDGAEGRVLFNGTVLITESFVARSDCTH
jgi:extracellular elastinolytic metalloproteinase